MDRAYEGNETRQLAFGAGTCPGGGAIGDACRALGIRPGDVQAAQRIERLFRRLKGYRRIFSRFEKLDVIFLGFILLALIIDALR